MRSPEVADAVGVLRGKGILSESQAVRLSRIARGDLVSARSELRVLLYAGVLLAVSGVGLFLKANHDRIGPAAIASFLAILAAGCFVFVFRRSPRFSWRSQASSHVAADYVLLLGILLAGSDLAYLESQFRFLGANWPYHLLVLSLLAGAAAYRFDSRPALSLGLSSFAAWRGLSTWFALESLVGVRAAHVRENALVCAVLFLSAAYLSVRLNKKPHFESVFAAFGWLLLFGALLSGVFQNGPSWPAWGAAALAAAIAVIVFAYRSSRTLDLSIGVVAGYLTLVRAWSTQNPSGQAFFLVVALSSLAVVALLAVTHRRMRREP